MKFRKYFVCIFLLTFLIGYVSALFITKEKPSSISEIEKVIPPITENKVLENPSKPVKEKFTPQIFGLKDFSDDIVPTKYKFKMVDVINHGNGYRIGEVIAKTGEKWLGLFIKDDSFYLKNTRVKIVIDEIDYGDQKWVSIKLKEKNLPLFLLKKGKKLNEGKVFTVFNAKSSEDDEVYTDSKKMYHSFFREFQVGEQKYTLRVEDALTESGDKVMALVLETENFSQVVTYEPYFEGNFLGDLLWVGDLDGDKKLDFYMNFNDYEKGSFSSSLFLSSEAEEGKLVKEAAGFGTAGC